MSPITVECHVDQVVNGIAKIVCKVGNVIFYNECPYHYLESTGIPLKGRFILKIVDMGTHFELAVYSVKGNLIESRIGRIPDIINSFMSDLIDEDS